MDYTRICIRCMEEKQYPEAICPYCGFDPQTYVMKSYALPPMTILNGKYILGIVLGAGGFGITYAALDLNLERRTAIKEFFLQSGMYRSVSNSPVVSYAFDNHELSDLVSLSKERFEREAKLLAKVEELPGIVRVYDFFKENQTCYMVLEYLEGVTLKEYVRGHGGILPVSSVLEEMYPVMDSLAVLHDKNILHRDISPDNMMVMSNGGIKLFDFGGAKTLGSMATQYSVLTMMKNGFSPIEQIYNDKQGPWTDEYALAATIYYCITGKVPVNSGERVLDTDMLQLPSSLGVDIPLAVENVLMCGLAIRRSDRYPDIRIFKDELKKAQTANINKKSNFDVVMDSDIDRVESAKKKEEGTRKVSVLIRRLLFAVLGILTGFMLVLVAFTISEINNRNNESLNEQSETSESIEADGNPDLDIDSENDSVSSSYYDEMTNGNSESSHYYDFECYLSTDETITISGWHGSSNIIKIPEEIDGYSVTTIGNDAFSGCNEVTRIDIPDSVLVIEDHAFYNCEKLISVTIPRSVEQIGKSVFVGCTNLKRISVSYYNEHYSEKDYVLFSKDMTTLISFPSALEMSYYAIPEETRRIEELAFANCQGVVNVRIPKSVESIAVNAFYKCPAIFIVDPGSYAEKYARGHGKEYGNI